MLTLQTSSLILVGSGLTTRLSRSATRTVHAESLPGFNPVHRHQCGSGAAELGAQRRRRNAPFTSRSTPTKTSVLILGRSRLDYVQPSSRGFSRGVESWHCRTTTRTAWDSRSGFARREHVLFSSRLRSSRAAASSRCRSRPTRWFIGSPRRASPRPWSTRSTRTGARRGAARP